MTGWWLIDLLSDNADGQKGSNVEHLSDCESYTDCEYEFELPQ